MTWRENLDKNLRPYVERLIKESFEYKKVFDSAKDKGKAQLWIALAILSKQIYDIKLELKYIERTLQDISKLKRKKEEKEVEKFIKELAGIKKTKKTKTRKAKKKKSKIKIAKSL